jgi:hypothetical protein
MGRAGTVGTSLSRGRAATTGLTATLPAFGSGICTTVCGIVKCCGGEALKWKAGGSGSVPA